MRVIWMPIQQTGPFISRHAALDSHSTKVIRTFFFSLSKFTLALSVRGRWFSHSQWNSAVFGCQIECQFFSYWLILKNLQSPANRQFLSLIVCCSLLIFFFSFQVLTQFDCLKPSRNQHSGRP